MRSNALINSKSTRPAQPPQNVGVYLSDRAKQRLQKLYEETETFKGYTSDIKIFNAWRNQRGLDGTPSADDLCNFLADQMEGVLSRYNRQTKTLEDGEPIAIKTLERRRSGILSILKKAGVMFSGVEEAMVKDVIASSKIYDAETKNTSRGQASPLYPKFVRQMLRSDAMKRNSEFVRLRDSAMLAMFLVTGARRSEILGQKYGLKIEDLSFSSKGLHYRRVVLKQGHKAKNFTGFVPKNTAINSAYHLIRNYYDYMVALKNTEKSTPFFIRATRSGNPSPSRTALTPRKLPDWLIKYALSARLPEKVIQRLSGHSLRVGAIVYLYEMGMDKRQIAEITGQTERTIESYAKQRKHMSYDGGL